MGTVGDAQQRPAGRSVPPNMPVLRQTSALQERGTALQQDDFCAVASYLVSRKGYYCDLYVMKEMQRVRKQP